MKSDKARYDRLWQDIPANYRRVLNVILSHHLAHDKWMPTRLVHSEVLKSKVQAYLNSRPSLFSEERNGHITCYRLTFLGLLLANKGPWVLGHLELYLGYLKRRYKKEPMFEYVDKAQLCEALNMDEKEFVLLRLGIDLSSFEGGGSVDLQNWSVHPPSDVDDLPEIEDFSAYVLKRAFQYEDHDLANDDLAATQMPDFPPQASQGLNPSFGEEHPEILPQESRSSSPNYRKLGFQAGNELKYDVSVGVINRAASAVFQFVVSEHPEPSITSARAQRIFDCILSLSEQRLPEEKRWALFKEFIEMICSSDHPARKLADLGEQRIESKFWDIIHSTIAKVAKEKFEDGYLADAVEAGMKEVVIRVRNEVKDKIDKELDGVALMLKAFSEKKPIIQLGDPSSETGRSIQRGYMNLFSGAVSALRNPAAHENLKKEEKEAIHEILVASLLMMKLDEANVH